MRVALAAILVLLFVAEVDARPGRRRSRGTGYTTYSTTYTGSSWGSDPASVASAKAAAAAARGVKGHLGGGYGGANAEGVAFSTYSAQNALNNCCFTGQRSVAASAVVRGSDGWYAVKLYW
jgi:hypothetical protein